MMIRPLIHMNCYQASLALNAYMNPPF